MNFLADTDILWPGEPGMEYALSHIMPLRLACGLDLMDVLIAATALRHGLPLATFNVKHFRQVPGLKIVQPYTR